METTTPAPEDMAWMAAARPARDVLCDAFFHVAGSVYVGPEDGMTPAQWESERIPLPPPGLPLRLPGRVAARDLAGREEALAAHYEAMIRAARGLGRVVPAYPYFAVSPAILEEGAEAPLAAWPWSDTLPEAAAVLATLAGAARAAPGTTLLDEEEQGWRLRLVAGHGATRGEVLLVEWDAEGPPPPGAARRLEADALAGQAAAAAARLGAVHRRLRRLLGRDFWS